MTSFNIIYSKAIHKFTGFPFSLELNNNSLLYMCQIFIICSSVGLLGCFYFLAVLNKAAINLDIHVSEHKCKNSKQNSCKPNSGAH